jgi:DNA polymerase-4
VPPHFDVYRSVSRQIHAIFADYTPLIELLSLDEAYLDVTENRRLLVSASATAKEIRDRILHETALTASAGVSYNKFLAKLASSQRKPNGQFVVTPEMGRISSRACRSPSSTASVRSPRQDCSGLGSKRAPI